MLSKFKHLQRREGYLDVSIKLSQNGGEEGIFGSLVSFICVLCPMNNSGLYCYFSIQKEKISNEINSLMCHTEWCLARDWLLKWSPGRAECLSDPLQRTSRLWKNLALTPTLKLMESHPPEVGHDDTCPREESLLRKTIKLQFCAVRS